MITSKIKELQKQKKVTIEELATSIGMTKNGLFLALKNGDFKISILSKIADFFKVPITVFLDDKPKVDFGEGFEKQRAGATLGERIEVIGRNLTRAEEWMENVEFLKHENEELRAMVESQQRTIQAHEATIAAMRESMQLLKGK